MVGFYVFLIFLVIIASTSIVSTVRYRARLKALTIERRKQGLDINSFVREFDEDLDKDLLIAIYRSIACIMTGDANEFIVSASDTLAGTYEFNDELGKQEFVELALKDTGRSIAYYLSDPGYPELDTVKDLAYLVVNQPLLPNITEPS